MNCDLWIAACAGRPSRFTFCRGSASKGLRNVNFVVVQGFQPRLMSAERASAARLMMTIAQILKHVDGTHPVRFLIAETETGYTLLAALWLARHYGIADKVEITPLFETASALEQGIRVLDDALRNPHWRQYLKRIGRLTVQFGYSDSGRYVGQLAATFWIERLRLHVSQAGAWLAF